MSYCSLASLEFRLLVIEEFIKLLDLGVSGFVDFLELCDFALVLALEGTVFQGQFLDVKLLPVMLLNLHPVATDLLPMLLL